MVTFFFLQILHLQFQGFNKIDEILEKPHAILTILDIINRTYF